MEGFGPLKAALSDILAAYADREVRSQLPAQNPPLTKVFQGIIAVENSIKKFLPRIVTLEEHFDSRPGDVAEHRRREELIWYAMNSSLRFSPDFPIASSRALKGNFGRSVISGGYSSPLIVFKTMKPCSVFSKIYKRPSSATRFAHNRWYSLF